MALEKEIRQIEQFVDGSPAQSINDWGFFRRENPAGSGKYESIKLPVSELQNGVLGNTILQETFAGASLTGSSNPFYLFGYYNAPAAHKQFTQAAATQTLGSSGGMYGGHAFVVVSGVGSVDTGVVHLKVTGTSVTDAGVRTTSDTEVLIADVTAISVVANAYFETSKKWLGQITFTLEGASGSPTTFSLTANYGFASYQEGGYTVDTFKINGHCETSDSTNDFDIIIYKHPVNGEATMTYSAAAFDPGGTRIFRLTDVVSTDNLLTAANPFSMKRSNISTDIEAESGFVVAVTMGTTAAITYMNTTIGIK